MGSLRSALDELVVGDVHDLTDDELTEHVVELERTARVLEAERARAIAELEARRVWAAAGFLSTTAWLADRAGVSASTATQQVRLSRRLGDMPGTRTALRDGSISVAAAGLLVGARESDPETFGRCESMLVEAARMLPVRDLRRAIEHWRLLADAEAGNEARRRFERRGLFVSATIDGMVRVDGDLDPETGQIVVTAVRSILDATARAVGFDDRRPAQRRADALGEICRHYLDTTDRPAVAGERPHLNVMVDLSVLESRSGTAELDDVGAINAADARRLACDASVSRIVTRGGSEPLDIGRRTSVVPAPLRRALVVRDRGCRFPGCDRAHGWCDAHHVAHWANGGETSLSNLILLCRRHHRLLHEGFGLRMLDGHPIFTRQDGTVLEDRAPPSLTLMRYAAGLIRPRGCADGAARAGVEGGPRGRRGPPVRSSIGDR